MIRDLTLDEVVEVTGGGLVDGPQTGPASGEEVCTSVSTDTRTLRPGALFVALRGDRHDAHDYLAAARDAGAAGLVVARALHLEEAHLPHVVVPDTTHALGDIARYVRDRFSGPVIGVTGSVGKTTVKEMMATVLAAKYSVHKSAENFNNEIGVPHTLFALEEHHTAAILEMGMRGAGQIQRLAEIAAPTIGVVTGIGLSHIELLGSRENIARAKGELFACLPADGGLAVYPAGDDYAGLLRSLYKGQDALTCAVEGFAEVQATKVTRHENGWRFTVYSPWGTQKMFLPSPGRFNILNALFAVAVGGHLGIPLDSIARTLLEWKPASMRLEIVRAANGATILSDAYNAAPDSMVGALETLRDMPVGPGGKRIAVLGEMRELGPYAAEAHASVGRMAARIKPDFLITVGELTSKLTAAAIAAGFPPEKVHPFETTETAVELVPKIIQPGDIVLVKGSRALALEGIVRSLTGNAPPEEAAP
ncbi:MAG: UDP-N-acetylmuramoyl-tripeptide--D-alanyl-D-alanine ligase [Capsulimonadales bacterium]|nr:UDP-N-acetylmuramoyl-tripeptide--D-alanyl-D-alanine ligase [Capsulimonadales bacterium]